jgi:hypothetical protein
VENARGVVESAKAQDVTCGARQTRMQMQLKDGRSKVNASRRYESAHVKISTRESAKPRCARALMGSYTGYDDAYSGYNSGDYGACMVRNSPFHGYFFNNRGDFFAASRLRGDPTFLHANSTTPLLSICQHERSRLAIKQRAPARECSCAPSLNERTSAPA